VEVLVRIQQKFYQELRREAGKNESSHFDSADWNDLCFGSE
jgi:hypothetical protein